MTALTQPGGFADAPLVRGQLMLTAALDVEVISDSIDTRGIRTMSVEIDYVRSAGTALAMSVEQSLDGTTWRPVQSKDASTPPDVTLADQAYNRSQAANDIWAVVLENLAAPFHRLRFNGTATIAADTITVDIYGCA
jgi:hypothetical protein